MENTQFSDNIIGERFTNLEKSINLFLKQIKKNGLAKHLQYYRASNSFDAGQYVDLFDEILNEQRERLLLKIHQEIDHETFLINQYKAKLERKNQKCFNETKDLRSKNERYHQIFETINNRLSSLKNSQETTEQMYIQKTEALQGLIELNTIVQNKQKKDIIPICRQTLTDLHDDFSNEITSSISDILHAYKMRIDSQISSRIRYFIFSKRDNYLNSILKLKKEIDDIKTANIQFSNALKDITDFISAFCGSESDDYQSVIDQIPNIVDQLKKGIINSCLVESKSKYMDSNPSPNKASNKKSVMSGISTNADSFTDSIKNAVQFALSKREKQFEKLENFARKKRLNLQKEYDKALHKLDNINASRPDHTEIIDEMNMSSVSYIEKSKKLDETIKLLSKSPFISKTNNKSEE